MNQNAALAGTVINTTLELGAKHFVVCAGARNAPLISNLVAKTDTHSIKIWNHFDERSASFFALGLAKAKQEPVAILTTSGTAAAELLPAVIEAWYSRIPLILLTADRPAYFRGSGAPQSIEQPDLFQNYVGKALDLSVSGNLNREIEWDFQTPLHLNICLDEPCTDQPIELDLSPIKIRNKVPKVNVPISELPKLTNPIAIVGELNNSQSVDVLSFLKKQKIPAWFETTSRLREHPDLANQRIEFEQTITRHLKPQEVIRIGGVPSLRFWRDLEKLEEIKVLNVSDRPFSGLARTENVSHHSFDILSELEAQSDSIVPKHDPAFCQFPESEPAIVRTLSNLIPQSAGIFLGNSLPIREWNLAATHSTPHPNSYANRGANGIDGEVSTYFGISEAYDETWGIFGDLTALYDLNSPWIDAQLQAGRRRIVVLNNAGGQIFSRLPSMNGLDSVVLNRHQVSFQSWAEMWGYQYTCWNGSPENWKPISKTDTRVIIEIEIDQARSEEFWAHFKTIS